MWNVILRREIQKMKHYLYNQWSVAMQWQSNVKEIIFLIFAHFTSNDSKGRTRAFQAKINKQRQYHQVMCNVNLFVIIDIIT